MKHYKYVVFHPALCSVSKILEDHATPEWKLVSVIPAGYEAVAVFEKDVPDDES